MKEGDPSLFSPEFPFALQGNEDFTDEENFSRWEGWALNRTRRGQLPTADVILNGVQLRLDLNTHTIALVRVLTVDQSSKDGQSPQALTKDINDLYQIYRYYKDVA